MDSLFQALKKAHGEFEAARAEVSRLDGALFHARKALNISSSELETAKDNLLRAVGEDVDSEDYVRGIQ